MPNVNCSLLAVQVVLIKLTKRKNKLASNTTLKLKVTATRKGTGMNVNHCFIYIIFPGPIKYKQLREAWIKVVRRKRCDKKRPWQVAGSN